MVERGSVQHGRRVDEELADGVGSLIHGAPISARDREDLDPEAPAADELLAAPTTSADHDWAGNGLGVDHREALERSEIARWLLPSSFPCAAHTLVSDASAQGAPDSVIVQLEALPSSDRYQVMGELWVALGGHTEHRSVDESDARAAPEGPDLGKLRPAGGKAPRPIVKTSDEPSRDAPGARSDATDALEVVRSVVVTAAAGVIATPLRWTLVVAGTTARVIGAAARRLRDRK